jgi:hypothetical protein
VPVLPASSSSIVRRFTAPHSSASATQAFRSSELSPSAASALNMVRVDLRVLLAEKTRVVRVRRHALEAVEGGLLERLDVGIAGRVPRAAELDALGDLGLDTACRHQVGERAHSRSTRPGLQGVTQPHGLIDLLGDRRRVEVDVGERSEERIGHETAGLGSVGTALSGLDRHHGHSSARVDEQVLERGDVLFLAAYAHRDASGSSRGLFALVTEHVVAELLADDAGLAVDDLDRALGAGRHAGAAAVAELVFDVHDLAGHGGGAHLVSSLVVVSLSRFARLPSMRWRTESMAWPRVTERGPL